MRAPSAAGTARRLAAVAATLVVAALGLALPAQASRLTVAAPAFPPQHPTKVLVLGDSVMAGAAGRYGPDLPGREVIVDAVVNRTTGQGADIVARRGADWDVVVILLAHNDGASPAVYQPAADRILDQLGHVPRVVWLTLHEVRPYYADVNRFLRSEADHRRNLHIADWNAVANAHPDGVAGDGLHLNSRGAELMASLVAQQVTDVERERATFIRTLAADHLEARLRAAAAAYATTTTTPPATTAPDVGLIPPATADQDPPPTTTTGPTSSTADPTSGSTSTPETQASSSSSSAPLVAAAVGLAVALVGVAAWAMRRRRPPTA